MKKIFLSLLAFSMLTGAFSQRVGINTSTPQETLDVNGNIFLNNNLGIKITNPQFPLSFAPALGDKISLYGTAGPHYGFGIQPYLFQIHVDGSSSDIAFGWGHSLSFTELMRIKGNGNVGIGTNNPLAKLHVKDSSVLFTGAYSPNNPGNPPIEGDGARMMWYADKAAFRVGYAADGCWDKDNIGNGSVAMGSKTRASAYQSFAMGFKSWATGQMASAMGAGAHAFASYSTAIGWGPTASGVGSAAIGLATTAKAFASVSLGIWNDTSDNPDSILPRPNDRIFQIGNGEILFSNNNYTLGSQGNAMTVLRNGNVGIGTVRPNQKLVVNGNICATGTITTCSDIRYKQNFSPIAHSLSSILSLHGLYYYWKKNEFPQMEFADARQVGFSAQEVEKLFPEIVVTDASGYKSMDYGRLTPVLVEAIKEQQEQINALQQQIDEMKKMIDKLTK